MQFFFIYFISSNDIITSTLCILSAACAEQKLPSQDHKRGHIFQSTTIPKKSSLGRTTKNRSANQGLQLFNSYEKL